MGKASDTYVVTPTGDRPDAFALCVEYMNRQTVRPVRWIIIDDGANDTVSAIEAGIKIPYELVRLSPYGKNSIVRNLREAFSRIPVGAKVCVVEDDDWYPSNYVETMSALLDKHPVVASRHSHYYNVRERRYQLRQNEHDLPMHGNGFTGDGVESFRSHLMTTESTFVDSQFSKSWTGDRGYNDTARPIHITGFGTGRPGTTPAHRIKKDDKAWLKDDDGEILYSWIGEDVHRYLKDDRKVYVISNVAYPEDRKLSVSQRDLLVFLNNATSIGYYKDHENKVLYHRSPKPEYGEERLSVKNRYVYSAGELSIPSDIIAKIKSEYDWDYPIETGKIKSATTGYMVARYMERKYPLREIILVNFGYGVAKSTYRCPWHNWVHEDKVLSRFKHIFTADTADANSPERLRSIRTSNMSDYEKRITSIMVGEGCDQTVMHDYGEVYSKYLLRLSGQSVAIAVVNMTSTATARAIKKILVGATVYAIGTGIQAVDGIRTVVGDPYSEDTWNKIPSGLSLVIDDGTHRLPDILNGIPMFMSHLAPGGSVLVEDVRSDGDAGSIIAAMPGASLIKTTPVSRHGDDRIVAYTCKSKFADYANEVARVFTEEHCDQMTRHDYGEVYAAQFSRLVGRNAVVVGVGVYRGNSMRAIKRLLPDASVYGIEISPRRDMRPGDATVIVGDGYSDDTWDNIPHKADLIIEDGSHRRDDMLRGLPVFIKHLSDTGVLMVEDIPDDETLDTLLAQLPGAIGYHTTPRSQHNDDRILVYSPSMAL